MQSGYLITIDGEEQNITVPGKFSLNFLQACVDGPIERVVTEDGLDMIVNEEGMINNLPINPKAFALLSKRYKRPAGCTDNIHGKAFVFTKGRL